MPTLTIFYLTNCPYCKNAKRAIAELFTEDPAYTALTLNWIEEREQPDVANRYDYYRVPTIFCGKEKLYEADPSQNYDSIKTSIRDAFDRALA